MADSLASSVPADAAAGPFAEAIRRAAEGKDRTILTRDGRPVAAMVPLADLDALEAIEDAEDAAAAAAALDAWEAAGRPHGTSLEELAARHGIDLSSPES